MVYLKILYFRSENPIFKAPATITTFLTLMLTQILIKIIHHNQRIAFQKIARKF
jgi:hypothetical protein